MTEAEKNYLKGYCTVVSPFSEILSVDRYLCEKQIAENPIKNSNPNCYYRHLKFIQISFFKPRPLFFSTTA